MAKITKNNGRDQVAIEIGLNAAIVALDQNEPMILTVQVSLKDEENEKLDGLPFGLFDPSRHRTMEMDVRSFVGLQTGLDLEYIEQLYTFGDRGRAALRRAGERHVVSIGYLALTSVSEQNPGLAVWRNWYRSFPWEDWRHGAPPIIEREIVPRLNRWAKGQGSRGRRAAQDRVDLCFGLSGVLWDEEKVLDRYELLYEAGIVTEALRDGGEEGSALPDLPRLGEPMMLDHRRILATAMSRMRAKIKYRPVIFDLMPDSFTLLQLQKSVEAISGSLLHKQNFRRLVQEGGLVEATGKMSSETGGRPAKLYGFRKEVLLERRTAGVRVRT